MKSIIRYVKRITDFKGRSRRSEVFVLILLILLLNFTSAFAWKSGNKMAMFASTLTGVLLLVALLAVSVRRLHDYGFSGLWLFLGLLATTFLGIYGDYIAPILWLFAMCIPGNSGPNRYGTDPRDDEWLGMRIRDLLHTCLGTLLLMLIYSLWASTRAACFDGPCWTTELIIHLMFDEAWLIGLVSFPIVLGIIHMWHHATGRQ